MNDELGKRMKEQYEQRTRFMLPRRTYTVIRVDGKAFHTLTRGFDRPFDRTLMFFMDQTAIALCKGIQGAVLGYTQSDEISIITTDFATPHTDAWFDGNVQKIASISAAIATAAFNMEWLKYALSGAPDNTEQEMKIHCSAIVADCVKTALFDSRVFTIPDRTEVFNYLIWRQQDAVRNSIQMAAQSMYSQKELHGQNTSKLQELMHQKGTNWNDYTSGEKRGRAIVKETYYVSGPVDMKKEPLIASIASRTRWVALTGSDGAKETPTFTAEKEFLDKLIPKME